MRKITGNKKGIDTILAALLMVVIVVVAAVMVYAWSTGLLGTLLVTPNAGKETLVNDAGTYAFNCPGTGACMNVTVNIRNSGSASVTLGSYYISDSSGNQWAVTTGWTNAPTLTPGQVAITKFYIGTTCTSTTTGYGSNCQYTGTSGSFPGFVSGYAYTVKVVTVKGTPFSFPITR
jgi:FlaG/FlaF family flagellin (archaellin)